MAWMLVWDGSVMSLVGSKWQQNCVCMCVHLCDKVKHTLIHACVYIICIHYFIYFNSVMLFLNFWQGAVVIAKCMFCHINLQTSQHHNSHMRLEVIDGVLHHRMVFTRMPVGPSDCVIYSDGHYSSGCKHGDLKAFVSV